MWIVDLYVLCVYVWWWWSGNINGIYRPFLCSVGSGVSLRKSLWHSVWGMPVSHIFGSPLFTMTIIFLSYSFSLFNSLHFSTLFYSWELKFSPFQIQKLIKFIFNKSDNITHIPLSLHHSSLSRNYHTWKLTVWTSTEEREILFLSHVVRLDRKGVRIRQMSWWALEACCLQKSYQYSVNFVSGAGLGGSFPFSQWSYSVEGFGRQWCLPLLWHT